jgi:hypothetical protein
MISHLFDVSGKLLWGFTFRPGSVSSVGRGTLSPGAGLRIDRQLPSANMCRSIRKEESV